MNGYVFDLQGARLEALPSGALWWADRQLLVVSDLHLGKSDRMARRGGPLLPPYETRETLERLAADIATYTPGGVLCLGDSFDDLTAVKALAGAELALLQRLLKGCDWIWIEGNHDPAPTDLGGAHLLEYHAGPLVFRHIAQATALGEVSGHYHPKARLPLRGSGLSRPCFLIDDRRVILPAYGAYTGGLRCTAPALRGLMTAQAKAALTGPRVHVIPMPG